MTCPSPKNIYNPTLDCYAPVKFDNTSDTYKAFEKICPFMDRDAPLCCKAD